MDKDEDGLDIIKTHLHVWWPDDSTYKKFELMPDGVFEYKLDQDGPSWGQEAIKVDIEFMKKWFVNDWRYEQIDWLRYGTVK